jgi:hypothetical protein
MQNFIVKISLTTDNTTNRRTKGTDNLLSTLSNSKMLN